MRAVRTGKTIKQMNTGRPMDYLRACRDKSFEESPFSLTDAILLCNITYIDLKGIAPEDGAAVTFAEMDKKIDRKRVFSNPLYGQMYLEMFELMKDSRRYGNIRTGYFREKLDRDEEAQFGAMTFFLDTGRIFVAFRGTDGSWLGWKEDFNYAYLEVMPSEKLGLEYLNEVASETTQEMYVGGHSKGGTIAVYSASNTAEDIQDRIVQVFSVDGIGFRKGFYELDGFRRIEERVCKVVPEEAFIGRIFEIEPNYRIAKSFERGMEQHDFMNWMVEGKSLVFLEKFSRKRNRRAVKFNKWITRLSKDQARNFVDTLFEIIGAANVDYIDQIFLEPKKYIKSLLKKLFSLKGSRRRAFFRTAFKYVIS